MSHMYGAPDNDLLLARNPSTPPAELARIASARPDLHAVVAANPAAYPALLDWLAASPDPAVRAVLAARSQRGGLPQGAAQTSWVGSAGSPVGIPPGARPAKKRSPVVAVLVVTVVLALIGGGVAAALLMRNDSSSDVFTLSNAWRRGVTEAWRIQAESFVGASANGKVIVTADLEGSGYRVTSWDVSGSQVKQVTSVLAEDYPFGRLWKDRVYVDGSFVDIRSGEREVPNWPHGASLVDFNDDVFVIEDCSSGNCLWQGWRSPSAKKALWEINNLGESPEGLNYLPAKPYLWVNRENAYPMIVDAMTGAFTEFRDYGKRAIFPATLADGWISCEDEACVVLANDGTTTGARFEVPETPPVSFPRLGNYWSTTVDDWRAFIEDGDTSWAEYVVMPNSTCTGVTLNGVALEQSESLVISDESPCPVGYVSGSVSPDGKTAFLWNVGLYDLTTGARLYSFDEESDNFLLVNPTLMVNTRFADDTIVGYRPQG